MFLRITWSDVPRGAVFTALPLQLDLIGHITHLHWKHLEDTENTIWGQQSNTLASLQLDTEKKLFGGYGSMLGTHFIERTFSPTFPFKMRPKLIVQQIHPNVLYVWNPNKAHVAGQTDAIIKWIRKWRREPQSNHLRLFVCVNKVW